MHRVFSAAVAAATVLTAAPAHTAVGLARPAAASALLQAAPTPTPLGVGLPTPRPRAGQTPAPPPASPTPPPLSSDVTQKIDRIAENAMREQVVPGLSLAVVRGGRVVYSRGYGFSSIELQQTMRDTSLYEIGSITKEFTATAILLLAEDGKLSIDDPLSKYVADFPRAKDITLRELLGMTSGIPDFTDQPDFNNAAKHSTTPADIISTVKNQPLDFEPGTQWEYSNTNYVLLGMVVEKAGGMDYPSFLFQRIFKPLAMVSTQYGNVGASSPDVATGYVFDGARVKPDTPWNLDWGYSTAGIVSNAIDLAVWDAALLQAKAITLGSLRQMWGPVALKSGAKIPYGFGWSIETLYGHREIDDNGGVPGYNGRNAAFPNDNFDVVVLANSEAFDAGPVVRQIFTLFYPPTAQQVAAENQGDDAAKGRARDVFRRLQGGRLDTSMLTPTAAKRLTAKLQAQARAQLGRLGAPSRVDQVDKYTRGTETFYYYKLTFKQGAIGFLLSFDPAGRVGTITVQPL